MNEIIEILWNVICIFNLILLFMTVICAQPDTSDYFAFFCWKYLLFNHNWSGSLCYALCWFQCGLKALEKSPGVLWPSGDSVTWCVTILIFKVPVFNILPKILKKKGVLSRNNNLGYLRNFTNFIFFPVFSAHNAYSSIHNHSIVEEYSSLLEGTQRWVTNQPNTSDNPYEDCSRKRSLNITAISKEIASELSHPSIQTFCLGVGCNTWYPSE